MNIQITLKGTDVSIEPQNFQAEHGKSTIKWKRHDKSDVFSFGQPPITFDDPAAPMSGAVGSDGEATCSDSNENDSGNGISYAYRVRLIDKNGQPITYPPKLRPVTANPIIDGTPTITNKPK